MTACRRCNGTGEEPAEEPVNRWVDTNPDYATDASARLEVSSVREPVEPPNDAVVRGEISVKPS